MCVFVCVCVCQGECVAPAWRLTALAERCRFVAARWPLAVIKKVNDDREEGGRRERWSSRVTSPSPSPSLSLSLSLSPSSLALCPCLSHSLSHSLTRYPSRSAALSLLGRSLSVSLSLYLPPSLSRSFCLSLSLSLSPSLSRSLSLPLSVSLSLCLYPATCSCAFETEQSWFIAGLSQLAGCFIASWLLYS